MDEATGTLFRAAANLGPGVSEEEVEGPGGSRRQMLELLQALLSDMTGAYEYEGLQVCILTCIQCTASNLFARRPAMDTPRLVCRFKGMPLVVQTSDSWLHTKDVQHLGKTSLFTSDCFKNSSTSSCVLSIF